MSKEFTTASGARVKMAIAPFQDGMALKNAILSEVARTGIDIDLKDMNLKADIDVSKLMRIWATVDSSQAVNDCLMRCLARCTYNGERVTLATFEDEKAREDYYEVVLEGLKVNLSPFFKGLFARLQALRPQAKSGDTQA